MHHQLHDARSQDAAVRPIVANTMQSDMIARVANEVLKTQTDFNASDLEVRVIDPSS
jgi:hypothetical protein